MTLTTTGLDRPRLDELKTDLDADITAVLGPVNVGPDAVLGQLTGIQAAALDDAYEDLQDTYDAMYPSSAEGVSLDRAVSFLGLVRIPAAPSVVTAAVYGTEGTIVPANAARRKSQSTCVTKCSRVGTKSATAEVTYND